jgi:hypothetical protein
VDWRRQATAAARFVVEYLDGILVIAIAAVVAYLDITNPDLDAQKVSSATLALLGATAFILMRDRRSRADLSDLRKIAADALSDLPYDIVWQVNEWELKDRERATVRMRRGVRFIRHQESTMAHWSSGPGEITRCEAKWRRNAKKSWNEAKEIDSISVRRGKKRTFSLGMEQARGDRLEWCVEMDVLGRFSGANQSVTHEAKVASDYPRSVRIVWPADERPRDVVMTLGDRPASELRPKTRKRRAYIEETVGRLSAGEEFKISWIW